LHFTHTLTHPHTPSHYTHILTHPHRYNNRTYRIDDISWDKNPKSTFIDHTGQPVSFINYYK